MPPSLLSILACVQPPAGHPADAADSTAPIDDTGRAAESVPAADEGAVETERLCQLAFSCDALPTRDTKVPCVLSVTTQSGDVEWDGPAEIWIRGRSSASVAKPGYGVELQDGAGASVSADLLGMGGESDWVVDGLWYDRLLVRDKLGYDLYRSWARANRTAESALCELSINGVYHGVHALVERIERDDDRVDIADGASGGGAFVLTQTDEDCFHTNTSTYGCMKLVSPDDGDLSADGALAIESWLAAMESAVDTAERTGDRAALWEHIDIDSAVDAVLLEEYFKNEDAFYTSMHVWKDEGEALHFVPWDLDMTFGQFPGYNDYDNPEAWIQYRPRLWAVMAMDPVFNTRLVERWRELRAGPLATTVVYERIDALQAILGPAIDRNFATWPIEAIDYGGWFYPVSTYADEEAYVRTWIAARAAFMDANIAEY